jgi:hypothetical protein
MRLRAEDQRPPIGNPDRAETAARTGKRIQRPLLKTIVGSRTSSHASARRVIRSCSASWPSPWMVPNAATVDALNKTNTRAATAVDVLIDPRKSGVREPIACPPALSSRPPSHRRTLVVQKRRLGRSKLEAAPFCLGGNVFGWTSDQQNSFRVLDRFAEAGLALIDTADVYSAWAPGHKGGESETVIGEWLKARGPATRAKVLIATKVGMLATRHGLKKDNIVAACDDSLKRLGIDVIDLYQSHRDDDTTPQEETLDAFAGLIKAGKVRAIGAPLHVTCGGAGDRAKHNLQLRDPAAALQSLRPRRLRRPVQDLCARKKSA